MIESDFIGPMGKRIAKIRKAHDVTQDKLANMLAVSSKHISHSERGVSCLSLDNLIEFCNLFDCSLDYLVWGVTKDKAASKLPQEIIDILNQGNPTQQDRLNKIFELFLEVSKEDNK
ncbi:MAG: helix-turn-helix transcriptional regulator [Lachnospiraceae bacterium]|nr:helix-turn-helix transcriptional regulator [Lachnospiraceae bacterium]MBQ9935449.1 helix-turn-helix transcriptional regulator [Lachnospiraceae bacterium]